MSSESREPQLEPSTLTGRWATVTLFICEGDEPGSAAHSRMWPVPADGASTYAEEMTAMFGPPAAEALTTVGAMAAAAESDAANGFVLIGGDD